MDKKEKRTLQLALGSLVAAGLASATATSADMKPKWEGHEKCYGIVKKGMNDCGNSLHDCASKAAKDNEPEEWIYVPKGTCQKIAGGSLEAKKK